MAAPSLSRLFVSVSGVWLGPGLGQYIMADTSRDQHCTMGKKEEAAKQNCTMEKKIRKSEYHCTLGRKSRQSNNTAPWKESGGRGTVLHSGKQV